MAKIFLALILTVLMGAHSAPSIQAQRVSPSPVLSVGESSPSSETESATPAASTIDEKILEKKNQDITEPTSEKKGKLVSYLEENPLAQPMWYNALEQAIRNAVKEGMSPNIIVLVLLFPLIASFIGASRHIIGLRGFGIYIPAVLSVALVSTGLLEGIAIFLAIIIAAIPAKRFLKHLRLPYLPRTALLIWFVSLAILGILLAGPILGVASLMSLNIFPVLILVLLAENYLDAQTRTKPADALALMLETIGLAFFSGLLLQWETLQKFALLEPELLILGTVFINLVVGKFTGLRLTEYFRFRSLMEEEE